MAKSPEIQARRDLIADIFHEENGSFQKVEDVLDFLWEHPKMRTFWEGFKARQQSRNTQTELQGEKGAKPTGKRKSKKPITKGDLNVTSAVRLVQRDMEVLEEQGLVEAVVEKEGRRVVVTASDRRARASGAHVAGAAQPLLWRAGPNLSNEVEMEGVAASVALDAICGKMAWLVPESLMDELIDARDRAKLRVAKMKTSSPQRRWLAALKLETPSPAFERPMFDEDVRQAIELAIMQRKQVRLVLNDRTVAASISRFIVKLPDRPVIEIWDHEDAELWAGGPRGPWCSWIRLESVRQATLLATDAEWPVPLDNDASQPVERHHAKVYEFRASPKQMDKWAGTWLHDQVEVIGEDADGWHTCRYVDTGEPSGFRAYLSNLGAQVEVLKPLNFRATLAQHFESAAAMYRDMQNMPAQLEQARLDEETLAAWGGVPRIVRPEWVPFTEDDHQRLQRSPAWRKEPGVVESLCRLFCEKDPAGLYSPSNPHAVTEYLQEVEDLFGLLPTIQSERAMAGEIRAIIHRGFASDEPADEIVGFNGWEGLASIAWLELTGFRVKLRATAEP